MINFQVISGSNDTQGAGKAAGYVQEKLTTHKRRESGTEYTTGYYSAGGAHSAWIGSGAKTQGLSGVVERDDLVHAMLGQIKDGPDMSSRGGKTEIAERRYAMDLTLSAPKSVSIMALAGGDERLLAAHDAAVAAAMGYVQGHMVYARLGKGGADSEFTGSMTAASFRHETSRTVAGVADPQLHTHNLVLNQTQRKNGTWASARLDFGTSNEKFALLDSIYKAELAKHVRAAGYDLEHTADGFEIRGITREQIEVFSARKAQIDAALEEHGLSRETATAQQRDNANTVTRESKSQLSDIDQKYEWRARAREQGIDLAGLREQSERQASAPDRQRISGKDAVKSALHHLGERDSTFTETALIDEALKAGLGDVTHAEIERAIAVRAGGIISAGEVNRGEGKTEQLLTTKAAVLREAEILQRARDGQGKAEAIIAPQGIQDVVPQQDVSFTEKELQDGKRSYHDGSKIGGSQEAGTLTDHGLRHMSERGLDAHEVRKTPGLLPGDAGARGSGNPDLRRPDDGRRVAEIINNREAKQGFAFSQGQRNAVALALTSQDQHIGIVGAAGAGKTTAMAAIVEQYKAAGYEVIGVAPSAAAAKELESAGCDDTRTLASALLQKQEKDGDQPAKRLYVMDESGMVSAKDMDAFMCKADSEGARSILVGDPRQLAAVEAGSPYAQMLKTGAIAHADIDEIQRQKDPQLREIAQAFAKGDAARGVELARPYMVQVRPEEGGKEAKAEALADAAAVAYLDLSLAERQKTLLLAGTNATRQAINEKIRDGLKKEGRLGEKAITVTALDKLDITREAATRAEHYTSNAGAQVVIQFSADLKNKDAKKGGTPLLAEKGSQWDVIGTDGGKLSLRNRATPAQILEIRPTDAKISAYEAREMELRAGDRIAFRKNDKGLGVTNGMQGVVTIDEKGHVGVKTDTGKAVKLDTNRGQTIDYSYARTVHSSQGATVERAIVVGEANRVATAESAYVACSREKTGLQIITDDSEKLGKAWSKFADRQSALATSKAQAPQSLDDIRAARWAAANEIGQVGDLATKRAADVEIAQEQEQEPEPAPIPEPELDKDLEIDR